jgi:enterochelin esterase-like enzyme
MAARTASSRQQMLFNVLDNLIRAHKLPPMVAIGIGAGGQDAQGSRTGPRI